MKNFKIMDKVLRIIETESCSVCQAYYIAPDKDKKTFERYGKIEDIKCGFDNMERAEELKASFKMLEEKYETNIIAEIFDLEDLDKHPLPKPGPVFA